MTPFNSSFVSKSSIPIVAATAACFGFLPVAKAFGVCVGIMYTAGIGNCAFCDTSFTISYSCGASFFVTFFALYIINTILSENQYDPKFIIIAKASPTASPAFPPINRPTNNNNAVSSDNNITVFSWFCITPI